MTTDVETSIITELSFLLNNKIFLTKSYMEDIFDICDDKTIKAIQKFLLQFSLNFTNNYLMILQKYKFHKVLNENYNTDNYILVIMTVRN